MRRLLLIALTTLASAPRRAVSSTGGVLEIFGDDGSILIGDSPNRVRLSASCERNDASVTSGSATSTNSGGGSSTPPGTSSSAGTSGGGGSTSGSSSSSAGSGCGSTSAGSSGPASVSYWSPLSYGHWPSGDVTAEFKHVPQTCINIDVGTPCAAHDTNVPPLFWCHFHGTGTDGSATNHSVGPLSAYRHHVIEAGERIGTTVRLDCPWPSHAELRALLPGFPLAATDVRLSVSFYASDGPLAVDIPFEGVPRGNIVALPMIEPSPPPPSPPPPSPFPSPPPPPFTVAPISGAGATMQNATVAYFRSGTHTLTSAFSGVVPVTFSLFGGGGSPSSQGSSYGSGGGGFCQKTFSLPPGASVTVTVGTPGICATGGRQGGMSSLTYAGVTYTAEGGYGGYSTAGSGGSGSSNCDVAHTGGTGGSQSGHSHGGGGGAAGPLGNGGNGNNANGGNHDGSGGGGGAWIGTGGGGGGGGGCTGYAANPGTDGGGSGGNGGSCGNHNQGGNGNRAGAAPYWVGGGGSSNWYSCRQGGEGAVVVQVYRD